MNKETLIQNIKKANKHYTITGENLVSDFQYEKWLSDLRDIEPNHRLLTEIGKVKVKSQGKVKHDVPMLSLDKVYNVSDLEKWIDKVSRNGNEEFSIMPKYDGISGRLRNGILSTRGDGDEGEDISHWLNYIVKFAGPEDDFENYDGEIVINLDVFRDYFASGRIKRDNGEIYKTPRNAISGILNNDEPNPELRGLILFVSYNYRGLTYYRNMKVSILSKIEFAKEMIAKERLPTDGIVVKLKDEEYGKSLGRTSHHWKNAIALKHDNEAAWTTLVGVEFQMAKEHIGIVGILKPVEINGVTISRVTLHNLDIIREFDLCIGDEVLIERSGDVIPTIRAKR